MSGKIRVGILFGGKSAEHEVSLQSAKNVIDAIDRAKYDVVLIGLDKTGRWHLNDSSEFLLNSGDPTLIRLGDATNDVALAPDDARRGNPCVLEAEDPVEGPVVAHHLGHLVDRIRLMWPAVFDSQRPKTGRSHRDTCVIGQADRDEPENKRVGIVPPPPGGAPAKAAP